MTTSLFASDSHLSSRTPEARSDRDAVADDVGETDPALLVRGDLALDGPNHPSELTNARRLLDTLSGPWRSVSGNRDIGDNPWPGLPVDIARASLRRALSPGCRSAART